MTDMPLTDNSDKKKKLPKLPKPHPFHITEPKQNKGLWCFWLTAEDDVLRFVYNLNCILLPPFGSSSFGRKLNGRVLFAINPRYDYEETWLWLNEVLDSEANLVELDDSWESAIREAVIDEDKL